jgi:O-antigen/teichoic acid export membrane protein
VQLRPDLSVVGGGMYLVVAAGGTFLAHVRGHLSPAAAWVFMGCGALVVSVWLALRLGVSPATVMRAPPIPGMMAKHRGYARWAAPSSVLGFAAGGLYYFLLPWSHGLETAGALRALANLVTPMGHASAAASNLLVPVLSRQGDAPSRRRVIHLAAGLVVAGGALYCAILLAWGRPLLAILYGNAYYTGLAPLLVVLGPAMVVYGLGGVAGAGLRSLDRPDRVFRASALSAVVAVTLGVGLTRRFGLAGAAGATLLAWGGGAAAQWIDGSRLVWGRGPASGPAAPRSA